MSDGDDYRDLREKWVHEDNLINHRLSWLIFSQSILFTAYAVLLGVPPTSPYAGKVAHLITILPLIGIAIVVIVFFGVLANLLVHRKIKGKKTSPEITGREWWCLFAFFPPIGLPLMFIVAWIVLLCA